MHREYVDQASGDVGQRKHAPAFDELMADARRRRCKVPLPLPFELPDRLKPPRPEAPAPAAV